MIDLARPGLPEPEAVQRAAIGFCRLLRSGGLAVPPTSSIDYLGALGAVGVLEESKVYWAGRATLIHRPEDIEFYDSAFDAFWIAQSSDDFSIETNPPPPDEMAFDGDEDPPETSGDEPDDNVQTVRFSRVEVLSEKDFADCTTAEMEELSALMARLRFTTYRRQSRRLVPDGSGGQVPNLRRTIRTALAHQGEPISLSYSSPASRARRLVILLDVSGSMETYSRALIRFMHAAVVARSRVEAFAFATRLTRITRQLGNRDPDAAIAAATPNIGDFSGGTRLGEVIASFNDEWGIRGMARGAVVVILSDGWDRGDPAQLSEQMERLHRVTHRLIWVNPLKATPGYAPLAAGMAAALPHLDDFVSGHSFSSISDLARIISGEA